MKKKLNSYKIHRILSLIFIPFFIISVATGFFRANYQWFWKENYKKIKTNIYKQSVYPPKITIDSTIIILQNHYNKNITISEIKLKNEIGKLFYDIKINNHPPTLIDANNGKILSPLSKDLAKTFAQQYVNPNSKLLSIHINDNYKTRKGNKTRPVYIATYNDPLNTKICIDKYNGEIEEEIDDNLKIGFWMIKLHDYDFYDTKKINLNIVSIGLFAIALSGLYIWLKKIKLLKYQKNKIISKKIS